MLCDDLQVGWGWERKEALEGGDVCVCVYIYIYIYIYICLWLT